jgi:hypothetical protein
VGPTRHWYRPFLLPPLTEQDGVFLSPCCAGTKAPPSRHSRSGRLPRCRCSAPIAARAPPPSSLPCAQPWTLPLRAMLFNEQSSTSSERARACSNVVNSPSLSSRGRHHRRAQPSLRPKPDSTGWELRLACHCPRLLPRSRRRPPLPRRPELAKAGMTPSSRVAFPSLSLGFVPRRPGSKFLLRASAGPPELAAKRAGRRTT